MHSKQDLYVGWYLPEGHAWKIQGWFWGKPLNHTSKKGTIWLNFTEADKQYSRNDDLQVALGEFTAENYGKLWAVVSRRRIPQSHSSSRRMSRRMQVPCLLILLWRMLLTWRLEYRYTCNYALNEPPLSLCCSLYPFLTTIIHPTQDPCLLGTRECTYPPVPW